VKGQSWKEFDKWYKNIMKEDQDLAWRLLASTQRRTSVITVGGAGWGEFSNEYQSIDRTSMYPWFEDSPSPDSVIIQYQLNQMAEPWSFLWFWAKRMALGSKLILFTHDRFDEWVDPYCGWEQNEILRWCGYTGKQNKYELSHGYGYAIEIEKRAETPLGAVVHAASVEKDGRAVLIAGPNGCGKTTVAACLIKNGWKFLGDKFSLVKDSIIYPGLPTLSLRKDHRNYTHYPEKALGYSADGENSEKTYVHEDDWKVRFKAKDIAELGFPSLHYKTIYPYLAEMSEVVVCKGRGPFYPEDRLFNSKLEYYASNLKEIREENRDARSSISHPAIYVALGGEGVPEKELLLAL
jgi:hypothetical protein